MKVFAVILSTCMILLIFLVRNIFTYKEKIKKKSIAGILTTSSVVIFLLTILHGNDRLCTEFNALL